MKKASLVALAILLLVALTACGSGKSDKKSAPPLSKDEKVAVASLEKAFTSSSTGALTKTEATCTATDFVSKVGLTKLKSSKLLTDKLEVNTAGSPSFDAETSGRFADALLGCVKYQQRLAEETAKTDDTIDVTKFAACLDKKLPDSLVKKMLVAEQTQSKDAATVGQQGSAAMTACKTEAKK